MDRERCSSAERHRTKRSTEPTSLAPSKTRRRLKRYENKWDVYTSKLGGTAEKLPFSPYF